MATAWLIKPLPILAAAASGTSIGAPANVGTDYAGIVWGSAAANGSTLTLDLGADVALDTIALFGVTGATVDATLTVALATAAQGNFTGASWSSAAQPLYAGAVMPQNGRGVALWAAPAGAPAFARYVRLTIASSSAVVAVISRAVLGKRVQLARNFSYGASFGVRDLGSVDFSRRGVLLRARGAKLRTVQLTFSNIQKDEVEAITKPLLEQIGNTEMIAVVTDPAEDPQRQNRCYFGPLVGDLSHTWRNACAFEAKANVVSLF